ncbi:protein-glutamine gamma-glutamyltransferase 5 [Salmo trutta]|uniref:protein-glutamine gamma-glutamyltransferase n=1 Tax=Salmo trutta TaxID=8032 RepID=A0A674EFR3_SALTR|nr:protein-glutamine gamma-glutamyltransferase 5-like [Salmo trutta]
MLTMRYTHQQQTDLRLKHVNLEVHDNHTAHQTLGLSSRHLVVRRGRPFKVTMLLHGRVFNPQRETLIFTALLGGMSVEIPVMLSKDESISRWSAHIHPGERHSQPVTVHVCSPAKAPVGLYDLQVHIVCLDGQRSFAIGSFVLLCNPWLQYDAVYIPFEDQRNEYVKNDFGILYMGTPHNVISRPWSFGQYEQGILEICLNILQVSPQHSKDKQGDYLLRADPVYISRVVCAMVNCEDDRGVLKGNWSGNFKYGFNPTQWTGSADILKLWGRSNFSPVRYGQCWVFASVMCTVMRVLGIPSRVVTIFNSAHDTNGNLVIEEYYTNTGEKISMSKDSIWNFHVWVECWMSRPDLGPGFDGWQVLDPTPQEKSGGIFCCGPCPVKGIRKKRYDALYDAPFIYASVNADVVTVIVRDGLVLGRSVDTQRVGSHILTKNVGSDGPQSLTCAYKCNESTHATCERATVQSLEVSLKIEKVPTMGENICLFITVTNRANVPKVLKEHVNAQTKEYNGSPQGTFWEANKQLHIAPCAVLSVHHQIPYSEYENMLVGEGLLNVAVVIKDERTKERVLASEEFNITAPQISIEVIGGDNIQQKKEHSALVSFTNGFTMPLSSAVLTVEGSGLMEGKDQTKVYLLQPGQTIEKKVSFTPTTTGTKLLQASLAYNNSPTAIRSFQKVSVFA